MSNNSFKIDVPITIVFDGASSNWGYPEYNKIFLKAIQDHINNILKRRGHAFVNDICDLLDIPRTSLGAIMGWTNTGALIDFNIWDDAEKLANPDEIEIKLYTQGIMFDKI